MTKEELLKLFDMTCLYRNLKYNIMDKLINKFYSDNFDYDFPPKYSYLKFPIRKVKIKKNKEKIKFNDSFDEPKINKKFITRMKTYSKRNHHSSKQLYIDTLNSSKKKRKETSEKFILSHKNKSKNKIIKYNYYNNIELISSDSSKDFINLKPLSPKLKRNNSNFGIHKKNLLCLKLKSNKEANQNISINKVFSSKLKQLKLNSTQSPNSTMVKTGIKNKSFLSDKNSDISLLNKEQINKKRIKSSLSMEFLNNSYKDKKYKIINYEGDFNPFSTKYASRHRKKFVKLKNLLSEIDNSRKNNVFIPDENKINSKIDLWNKFYRNKNNNSKSSFQIKKFDKQTFTNNISFISQRKNCDEKSRNLLRDLEKIKSFTNIENYNFRKINNKTDLKVIKKYLDNMLYKKDRLKKFDQQFKKEAIKYQDKIGKFMVYKGNWIFSSHLNTMLKGDRISRNLIKFNYI